MPSHRAPARVLATGASIAALCLFTAVPALAAPGDDNPGQGSTNSNAADAQSGAPGQLTQQPAPDLTSPQPLSTADDNGTGANVRGPFDSTRDGSPSLNGNGGGEAVGKPCAGCVGKADNKNPPGQVKNGKDNGYECDGNNGIGKGNPAHTSCKPTTPPPPPPPGEEEPPGKQPPGKPGEPGKPGQTGVTPAAKVSPAAEKDDDGVLAFTGASVLAPAFAGLALVGGGGAAIAVTRRRRVN